MPFISQALWRDILQQLTTPPSTASPEYDELRVSLRRVEERLDNSLLQIVGQSASTLEESGSSLLLDLFKNVAEVSIVLTALLYAAGWTYLYSYYKSFGLSLRELDLPLQDSLVFSFRVIFDSRPIALGLLLIVAILAWIANRRWTQRFWRRPISIARSNVALDLRKLKLPSRTLSSFSFRLTRYSFAAGQRARYFGDLKWDSL